MMRDFLESLLRPRPFVREYEDMLSLHFNADTLQSMMSLNTPSSLEVPYTVTMMGFLLAKPNPVHILMIGLGGGSLPKFCHQHLHQAAVTVVEINPEVIALRERFQIPQDDDRFSVVCADGACFVREAKPEFDVVLVDGFDAQGQAPQLCTEAFYEDCSRTLMRKGVLVANLDNDHPAHDVFVDRIQKTFRGNCVEIRAHGSNNSILFAGKDIPMSGRGMSLSWTLGHHAVEVQSQLKTEFQRILRILDGLEPLRKDVEQRSFPTLL